LLTAAEVLIRDIHQPTEFAKRLGTDEPASEEEDPFFGLESIFVIILDIVHRELPLGKKALGSFFVA
jgi:hypothetical protein